MSFDVNLNWDAVDEPHNEYRIYRDTSSPVSETDTNQVGTTQKGTTSFTDQVQGEGDITYYYAITAVRIEDGTDYESDAATISVFIPVQAVGKSNIDGTVIQFSANKARVNGSIVKISSVKTRQDGSIIQIN